MTGMIPRQRTILIFSLCLMLVAIISCAPPPQRKPPEIFWPLPPDEPRVKFVEYISSSLDLGRAGGAAELLFGEEKVLGFIKPYGIAVDREGKIYITDVGRVAVFDTAKKDFSVIGNDPGMGQLKVPIGIAAASDGRLFVTDLSQDRVFVYKAGKFFGSMGESGQLMSPSGVVLDEKRKLVYVTDTKLHKVLVYSLDSYKLLRSFGERGDDKGQFNYPTNIAIDAGGDIYVVDTGNFRVQIFDSTGKFVRAFGKAGDIPGSLARPKGIAIDSEGNVYVADAAFGNFQIFDKEGNILLFVGEGGRGAGKFGLPAGMAIDKDDKIYVVDQVPGAFQVFQYMGRKWKEAQGGKEAGDKQRPH